MKIENLNPLFYVRISGPGALAPNKPESKPESKPEAMSFDEFMKELQEKFPYHLQKPEILKILEDFKKIKNINDRQNYEIAKFCAERNGRLTAKNFKLFEIGESDKAAEIAGICLSQDGSAAKYFKNFRIKDPDEIFALAKTFAQKDDDGFLQEYFAEFKINNPDKRAEIAIICARLHPENMAEYFENFKINDPHKIFEIAKICALEKESDVALYFKNFGISDPDEKFEIAKIYAEKNVRSALLFFNEFEITDSDHIFEILKICAKIDSGETVKKIDRFIKLSIDKKFEIAKICAIHDGDVTAEYFKNFKILDPNLRFEIAKICARQNSIETCRHFAAFEINDRENVLKIAKLCILDKNFRFSIDLFDVFLLRNGHLTPKGKLDIFLLFHSLYGNDPAYAYDYYTLSKEAINKGGNLSDTKLLIVMDKCSYLFSRCAETKEPEKAIQLLRECCTHDLPCSVVGDTANQKAKALQNQALFAELLAEIENYRDKDGDINETKKMQLHQCRWLSNLFLRLTLDQVSIETVHQLRPIIRAISVYRDRGQRCFLNTLLCQDFNKTPHLWIEMFAAEASNNPSQALASILLYKLDPKDQSKLQASITSTPAKAVFKNGESLRHYVDACIVLAETSDLEADEQLAVLMRLDQAAKKQTEQDIAALQSQFGRSKPKQSLREDWAIQLQEGAVAKVQKNVYFQVVKQCLKDKALLPDPTRFRDERKALSQKLSALSTSFSLEKFQEHHFSQAYLTRLLSSPGGDVDDKALLAELRKFFQEIVESQLGDLVVAGEPRPDKITRDQIATSIASHVLSWYNKVVGENQAERQENFNADIASQTEGIFIRNLLKELSLFQTLLELGSLPAAKDFLKEAHLSPLNLLLPILQDRFKLTQALDVLKFFEAMATWRDPAALFTYAGRIGGYASACEGLGRFAVSLAEGTFPGQRYAQDNLDATFARLPKAFQEKWCDSAAIETPLEQMLTTAPGAASPAPAKSLHDICFNLFKENLSIHGHLGIKEEALWTSFPIFAKYFYGSSSTPQNIEGLLLQAEQDSADYAENKKKNAFQAALIQLIEQPDSLALLEAVQTSLTALDKDCELVRDLSGWKTLLLDRQNTVKKFDGWKVMVTDNPQLLFSMGTDVPGSCQSYAGTPELCRGLIGTVWDPKAKLVAITNGSGKIVGRCVVRITLNPDGKPVLLLEQQYPAVLTPPGHARLLIDQAIAYARMLGCDLVTTQFTKDAEQLNAPLVFGERKYDAYIDSLHGNRAGDEREHQIRAWFLYQHKEPGAVDHFI